MSAIFDEDRQFIDPLTDALLVGGKIYVGTAGLDPIVNPINVYDNRLFTGSPLAQPVIIDVNGRATSKMWVSGKYSLQIDSSADVQKYQELQNGFDEAIGNVQTTGSLGVNDITVTGVPVQTAYTDNKAYMVTAPADNTGAMTINIDGLGVVDIKKGHDQAITSGDVKADMKLQLIYNSTDGWMELQSGVLGSVFSGGITVTNGIVTDTVTASGVISVDDTTDSTSGVTGSIHTDGGLGIAKDLYVGVNAEIVGDLTLSGIVQPTAAATVTDHIRAGTTQILKGDGGSSNFDLDIAIPASTYETVGPTGSGADNIWTDMDVIPANASVLIANLTIGYSQVVDSDDTTVIVGVVEGDAVSPSSSNILSKLRTFGGAEGALGYYEKTNMVFIPLGATNQDFHFTWDNTNGTSFLIRLNYMGFMTD